MIDLTLLRESPDVVRAAMLDKRAGNVDVVDHILDLDARRRAVLTETHTAQAEANRLSREVGALMKAGDRAGAEDVKQQSAALKGRVKELEVEAKDLDEQFQRLLLEIPNIPHPSVPRGTSEADNQPVYEFVPGAQPDFPHLPHWELAANHGLIDFERGTKVAGAGFPFYVGKGARLQRALIAFFLDQAGEAGYTELQAPHVVNEDSARGTGQLPDKEDLMYEAKRDGLYLIPTAEVPVTNFHRDEVLDANALPIHYAAYTPCFRREAGSYGKDVRGLNRLHQFDKVELVKFVHPDTSYDALEALREDAERLLVQLGLRYRRLLMCSADLGFTQTKKYDLEVWSPGQDRWLEVSSVSNFEAFQARRANIRFREGQGKPRFVHTLNGSGLALPRVLASLLETHQQPDGSVRIPPCLVPYTGFDVLSA